jgi:uncharacterized membrane protein
MNTHIVTEPSSLIRKIARDALKNHWKDMFLGIAIYTLLTGYVSSILSFVFPRYETIDIYGQSISYNTSFVGFLYEVLLIGAFMYGLALFMLTFFRTKRTDNKLLFEGFSMLGKTILLQIVTTVFIFLWSLLFVIPGIIAAIRYSMAFYILADHPEYTVTQCINESKARMRGNCGKYFVLILSFIGWGIVASLAQSLIEAPFAGGSLVIGNLIGLIPLIFLYVYVRTTETVFFELLTENLVVMVPDQHVQDQGVNPGNMVNANYEIHEETASHKEPAPEAAPAAEEAPKASPEAEAFMGKVSDIADSAGDIVSDAADKIADIQDTLGDKIGDKIDDIVPDTLDEKIDSILPDDYKAAEGAPDVPVQVYEAKAEDIVGETPDEFVNDTPEPAEAADAEKIDE